jgi:hypothetical protein
MNFQYNMDSQIFKWNNNKPQKYKISSNEKNSNAPYT